jgi:trigger factor
MAQRKGKKTEGVARLIKMSPVAETLSPSEVALPEVAAPSLAELKVVVPAPSAISSEELLQRLHEKTREAGTVKDRAMGDALRAGDEVLLDVLGYADGKLIPFSSRFSWWTELAPIPALPGLMEGVATAHVGDSLEVLVTLPENYPQESLRNCPVRFVVDVLAAREVIVPEVGSKTFFEALGLGDSLDDVMDRVREELEEERSAELSVLGRELVLEEVARRTAIELPKALVDDEIKRRWAQHEAPALAAHQFTADEQKEARDGWLADPMTRAECERRLKVGMALRAVAQAERLEPQPEELRALLAEYAAPWGVSETELDAALKESKKTAATLGQLGYYLWMVDHVVSRAQIELE